MKLVMLTDLSSLSCSSSNLSVLATMLVSTFSPSRRVVVSAGYGDADSVFDVDYNH